MEVRVITTRRDKSRQASLRYSKYALKQLLNRARNNPQTVQIEVYDLEGHTGDGKRIHQEFCNVGD